MISHRTLTPPRIEASTLSVTGSAGARRWAWKKAAASANRTGEQEEPMADLEPVPAVDLLGDEGYRSRAAVSSA